MTPDDVRQYLQQSPFVPLRFHTNSGRTVDVRHPEMAIVGDEAMAVTEEIDGRAVIRLLALINISEIEQRSTALG